MRPRKRFGQHFLHDVSVIDDIISAISPQSHQHILEIGPGQGVLTAPLLARAARVDAVEIDRDLAQALRARFADTTLTIHNEDALCADLSRFIASPDTTLRVVGNLPYNISTPLLFHLLEQCDFIDDMHFMLQREVVERMVASPGSKAYGRLSVMLGVRCEAISLFDVTPDAFHPPPSVMSSVVRLVPHAAPIADIADNSLFATLVRDLFNKRRKTLRTALKGKLSGDQIVAAGIEPALRAEVLTVEQFARLANKLASVA